MKTRFLIIAGVLFAIGIASIMLIVYDYFTTDNVSPSDIALIGEEQASRIAFDEGSWTSQLLQDKQVDLTLLHIKNDGFTFLVDQESLADKNLYMTKFSELEPDQYVWLVVIQNENNREWNYLIDAKKGKIIRSPQKSFEEFQPVNPYKAIDDNSPITQAQGDVIVEFPKGITESKSTPFPAELVVTVGDTITWENNDGQAHSVADVSPDDHTDVGRIFDSGIIGMNESFSFTFEQRHVGEINYACLIHPWETGSIIIQAGMDR